jgi:hypothetical protein
MKNMQAGPQNTVHRASSIDARARAQEKLNKLFCSDLFKSYGLLAAISYSFGVGGNATDGELAIVEGHTFEFTEYNEVDAGHIPVLIGEDGDATLEAFAAAINDSGLTTLLFTAFAIEDLHSMLLLTTSGPGNSDFVSRVIDPADFDSSGGTGVFTIQQEGSEPVEAKQSVWFHEVTEDDLTDGITVPVPFQPVAVHITVLSAAGVVLFPTGLSVLYTEENPIVRITSDEHTGTLVAGDFISVTIYGA